MMATIRPCRHYVGTQAPIEPPFGTNLGRLPLGTEALCRCFDADLVQMIRSQLRPEEDEEPPDPGCAGRTHGLHSWRRIIFLTD